MQDSQAVILVSKQAYLVHVGGNGWALVMYISLRRVLCGEDWISISCSYSWAVDQSLSANLLEKREMRRLE